MSPASDVAKNTSFFPVIVALIVPLTCHFMKAWFPNTDVKFRCTHNFLKKYLGGATNHRSQGRALPHMLFHICRLKNAQLLYRRARCNFRCEPFHTCCFKKFWFPQKCRENTLSVKGSFQVPPETRRVPACSCGKQSLTNFRCGKICETIMATHGTSSWNDHENRCIC